MSPRCTNCGSRVSETYARVKWDNINSVPACPTCDDRKLEDGRLYEYTS